MLGVILSIGLILLAIFVVYCDLGILYKMYKNIKEKDWRGAVFYFVGFAIGTPYFYLYFTRTYDVRKAFTEIITYFS